MGGLAVWEGGSHGERRSSGALLSSSIGDGDGDGDVHLCLGSPIHPCLQRERTTERDKELGIWEYAAAAFLVSPERERE